MKKILASLIFLVLNTAVFSHIPPPVQNKSFPIHTEKRMFIKKGDRHKHKRHHHHPKKNKNGDKMHSRERHKK